MGKSLIITEKPSVAQEFAKVLHVSGRNNGYIENDEYVITWCVGHLVGLVYPESYDIKYKKWKLEDLPFLPEDYKYDVIKEVSGQYDIVHKMLHREDISKVYWAGDAGKEGQTIEENIRNYGGVREGMEELRVWIDSQTEEEILRGINEAKPMSDYANLGNSGIMRTIEDYAMGINFSRVMSVKYGQLLNDAAGTKSYTAIAVGRVMTCVLGMVVIREREIRNFKETSFYRVIGSFTDANVEGEWKAVEGSKYFESPLLYKENGFKEEKDAQALIEQLNGKKAFVKSIDKNITKKRAPLLFNLAELQAECSKRFKISPDETLQVAQDLYEKKLTTYPRTDARVLSSAVGKEIYKNISRLKGYEPTSEYVEHIISNKLYGNITNTQYTDDSKVTDHYAIIPTGQLTELGTLNSLQRAVFDVIVRRFLSIFYPPAEYQNVKLVVGVEKENFFASSKVLKTPGYLEVATPPKKKSFEENNSRILGGQSLEEVPADGEKTEENMVNPKILLELADRLKQGDEIDVTGYAIKYGKTSPPKRYTSGSMVLAMENAGQLIEDEELREQIKGSGIGTSATRAEIIKKLVRIGYLNLNKKTQILTPENLGEMIFEVVSMTVPALLNPKMTASWEKGLEGITQGTVDFGDYRNKLEEFIRTETLKMIGQDIRYELAGRISEFAGKNGKGAGARRKIGAKCPVCGGELVTTPFGFGCSNYKTDKTGCNFNIGEIAGVTLSDEQAKKLAEEGHTDTIRGFKSKSGKRFDACLVMKKNEEGKVNIEFDFDNVEEIILEDVKCPICDGSIKKTFYGYGCCNYNRDDPESCKFSVGEMCGKTFTESQVKQLLKEGSTEVIRGFKSKNGKRFDARVVFARDENDKITGLKFDFDQVTPEVVKDVVCPVCGGDMIVTPFGFGCRNYRRDDPQSCRFSVGEIAGKKLNVSQLKQLLTDKKTETIRGFKGKSGKKFDACLVLKEDENKQLSVQFDFENVEAKQVKDVVCPVCGGDIVATPFGFGCANYRKEDEQSCRFSIGKMAEKALTEAQVKQLLTDGVTEIIRGFKSKSGKKFDAKVALSKDEEGKVTGLRFDFDDVTPAAIKDVVCPVCGGDMVATPFGFGCANYKKNDPSSCRFSVGEIAGKKLNVNQLKQLLNDRKTETIRGFKGKSGKKFDACLVLKEDENKELSIQFDFDSVEAKKLKDVVCPVCGSDIVETPFGYGCSNYDKDDENSCRFNIGKIAGVKLKEAQIKQLLTEKKTDVITGFIAKTGMMFDAPLRLSEEGRIEFDFPEKPEPVDSNLPCPKCQKLMKKAQWQYECECGYKLRHTVAQVELSEEILAELLSTGKTRNKVTGFTSKSGNVFDTCLKFEDDQIKFDFDNPGENSGENSKADAGKLDFSSISEEEMQTISSQFEDVGNEAEEAAEEAKEQVAEEAAKQEIKQEGNNGDSNE